MFTKPTVLAVTFMGTTAFVWLAACSSSSKGNNDASSNSHDGSPNNPAGGDGGLVPCGPSAYCTNPLTCTPSAYCESPSDGGGGNLTICSGPATEATIDDMTASTITFTPPSCATKGEWFTYVDGYADGTGTITPATTQAFTYSALPDPAGLPAGVVAVSDAGAGGVPGPMAACVKGSTNTTQYEGALMAVQLGNSRPAPDGTSSPAMIDASAYTGIQFWLWASADTASAISESFEAQLHDKNETLIFGICNGLQGQFGCGPGIAAVSGSAIAALFSSGALLGADGGNATVSAGWQLIKTPFVNFIPYYYYGGGNETAVDPKTLTIVRFEIANAAAASVAFDYCVYDLAFY
jgi:hypothetical protein